MLIKQIIGSRYSAPTLTFGGPSGQLSVCAPATWTLAKCRDNVELGRDLLVIVEAADALHGRTVIYFFYSYRY